MYKVLGTLLYLGSADFIKISFYFCLFALINEVIKLLHHQVVFSTFFLFTLIKKILQVLICQRSSKMVSDSENDKQ